MYLGNTQLRTIALAATGSGSDQPPQTVVYDADATVTIRVRPSATTIHVRANR